MSWMAELKRSKLSGPQSLRKKIRSVTDFQEGWSSIASHSLGFRLAALVWGHQPSTVLFRAYPNSDDISHGTSNFNFVCSFSAVACGKLYQVVKHSKMAMAAVWPAQFDAAWQPGHTTKLQADHTLPHPSQGFGCAQSQQNIAQECDLSCQICMWLEQYRRSGVEDPRC